MSSIFLFSTSRIFLPDICAQPFHAFCRMCKKHPVRRTQLIQPRLSIHKRLAPSAAAASAQGKMQTFLTGCTDRSGSLHKCFCFFRSFHLYKSIVHGSQFPLIHAIKITRIHTSVSFYHKITVTAAVHSTFLCRISCRHLCQIGKHTDIHRLPCGKIRIPQIKQPAEKCSVCRWCQGHRNFPYCSDSTA